MSVPSRSNMRRLALSAGVLLVSLVLAEGAFRAKLALEDHPSGDDGGWRARYIHMNETIYRRSNDAALVYEPVRGASVEMEYGPAGFNAAGMRDDREFRETATDGVRRVAVVGDSLVWSEFLALEDTIPRQIEASLGDGFEVMNFGVTGYDLTQEAAWYERAVRPLHPDVVVVVYCMNDMMIMSGPFERYANPSDRARKDSQEARQAELAPLRRETLDGALAERERQAASKVLSRAWGLFERWRFDRDYTDEYLLAFAHAPSRERAERAIDRLGAAIEDDGARPLFVISPVLERWDDYRWRAIHAHVRDRAEAAGFTVVDPLDDWRETEDAESMRVGGDNLHYDRSGARVMGRTIAAAVREGAR
ncbi:MAG: SGNH/GDSL hydrolase family protein [Sandaracinaceae bacterium]